MFVCNDLADSLRRTHVNYVFVAMLAHRAHEVPVPPEFAAPSISSHVDLLPALRRHVDLGTRAESFRTRSNDSHARLNLFCAAVSRFNDVKPPSTPTLRASTPGATRSPPRSAARASGSGSPHTSSRGARRAISCAARCGRGDNPSRPRRRHAAAGSRPSRNRRRGRAPLPNRNARHGRQHGL